MEIVLESCSIEIHNAPRSLDLEESPPGGGGTTSAGPVAGVGGAGREPFNKRDRLMITEYLTSSSLADRTTH